VVVDGLAAGLDSALRAGDGGRVFALPTYTALLELRQELASRGLTSQFWEKTAA
jgi:hypothetical protein